MPSCAYLSSPALDVSNEISLEALKSGLKHIHSVQVDERLTIPAMSQAFTGFSDWPSDFATTFPAGFVECTCIEALRPISDPVRKP